MTDQAADRPTDYGWRKGAKMQARHILPEPKCEFESQVGRHRVGESSPSVCPSALSREVLARACGRSAYKEWPRKLGQTDRQTVGNAD